MKRLIIALVSAALCVAAPSVFAAKGASESAQAVSYTAVGVVKKVEPESGTVMLRHEPIAALGWPAMTMPFAVKDKKVLANLKPHQKIEFSFVQQGSAAIITSIR